MQLTHLGIVMLVLGCAGGDGSRDGRAAAVSLEVAPFRIVGPVPSQWSSEAVADSLRLRLERLPDVDVQPRGDGSPSTYALRGDVSVRDRRLMINTTLSRSDDTTPTWSSTFWRAEDPLSQTIDDVATAVAEALSADMTRRMITTKGRQP